MANKLAQGASPKIKPKASVDEQYHLRLTLTDWTKNRLVELVENGTFKTMGGAADQLIKNALALDSDVQWKVTIPDHQVELTGYYPLMARDMAPGVWSSLNEGERRLCVLIAFFSSLNDVEMSRWASCTPGHVKSFRVSNLGLESVRIGEQRALLSNRLRFWSSMMVVSEDPEHPAYKESLRLLGNRLFAPAEKRMLLNMMGQDPDGAKPMVLNPREVDMEFMEYAASIQMTPERYVKLYADMMGEDVRDILSNVMRRYRYGTETEGEVVSEE